MIRRTVPCATQLRARSYELLDVGCGAGRAVAELAIASPFFVSSASA
ncbi:hypothetical protein ACFYZ5_34125 [Streptomyces chartreusis]|nr:hypothetical protein [Streptomyces chartreusis]WUB22995.1 hypothetical protein OG997_42605 [Streptomyces chartreusis]